MARTLWFRGVQFATGTIKVVPAAAPQTPPGISSALFADRATVIRDSRNLLYALEVSVWLAAADEIDFASAALDLQEYAGLDGTMEIKDGATTVVLWEVCTLGVVPRPDVAAGFGGRFTPDWAFAFLGESKPEFPS